MSEKPDFCIKEFRPGVWQHDVVIQWLEGIEAGLAFNLARVAKLTAETRRSIVAESVELACLCQNIENILIGRYLLLSLPTEVIDELLKKTAGELIDWTDDYEYHRILEVADALGAPYFEWAIERGRESTDIDVRETAQEWCRDR